MGKREINSSKLLNSINNYDMFLFIFGAWEKNPETDGRQGKNKFKNDT
jgi:hypothetical protein